jgi:hypothetical protein
MRYVVTMIGMICLLACSSEETTRTAGSTERPIAFGDAYTVKPTRSSEQFTADKGIPLGQSMGIYAYLHEAENANTRDFTSIIPNFMYNQQATSRDDADYFSYSPLKYWPNDDNSKVSFIAYFPYCNESADDGTRFDTQSTGISLGKTNSTAGLPTFNFTVKDNIADQVDFLVSDMIANMPKTRDTENDPGQPFNDLSIKDRVTFLFKHMTAKVEFRIVADPEIHKDIVSFTLSTLNVSNLYKDGTLTPAYNPATGETSFTWSGHTSKHGESPSYLLDFKTYEPQLLMPQGLGDPEVDDDDDVMMNVSYTITFKSDGTTYKYDGLTPVAKDEYTYSNTASVRLKNMMRTGTGEKVTEWLPYHHYVYTIRLRANRIDFTGQVVDWGDKDTTDAIKIEE